MKNIYLIRHGQPVLEAEGKCLSRTDLSLDAVGLEQAETLAGWLWEHPAEVYSSPLKRCVATARIMAGDQPVNTEPDLAEILVGEWEGLSFREIRTRWPEVYEARGNHIGTVAPPGGESFAEGGERLDRTLERILEKTEGDIVLVTHAGILRGWLCRILGKSPDQVFAYQIPWGSVTHICQSSTGYVVRKVGYKPVNVPGPEEIQYLYRKYGTPLNVQKHCQAVAGKAAELARGRAIDQTLLFTAALLHDLCRTEGKSHPQKAAGALCRAGYTELAGIVAVHSDIPDDETVSQEAEILYLADKLFVGTAPVTLRERFVRSREKCRDNAALSQWQRRFATALSLEEKYMR